MYQFTHIVMVAHTPVGEGLAPPVCHGAMSYMREEQAPPLPMLQQLSSYNPALVILSVAFSRSSFRASVEESCARKRSRTFETSSQKRVAGSRGGAAIESRRISGGDVRSINIHFYSALRQKCRIPFPVYGIRYFFIFKTYRATDLRRAKVLPCGQVLHR